MAVDDVITDIISTTGNSDYQPASGVEVVLNYVGSGAANGSVTHYDGTLSMTFATGTNIANKLQYYWLGVTNTNYLRLSSSSGAVVLAYSGIQTK